MSWLDGYSFVGLGARAVVALGGAATALLIALYLLRERRARVVVSFAPLWVDAAGAARFERLGSRFRRWLSWLLQMLILVALLTAAADPRPGGAAQSGRTLVVLIDRSASLTARAPDGAPAIDAAKAAARDMVLALGPRDRALVASFGASVTAESGFDADPGRLGRAIASVESTLEPADTGGALRFASAVLRGRPSPTVVLIGDGRYDDEALAAVRAAGIDLQTIPVGGVAENAAVLAFSARRRAQDPGIADVAASVRSYGARPHRATLEVRGGRTGRLLAREPLDLAPGAQVSRAFAAPVGVEDRLEARLVFAPGTPDALAFDNVAYAAVPPRTRRRVLIVGSPNLYLDGALLSLGAGVETRSVPPAASEQTRAEWERFDLVIFDRVTPRPAPSAGRFLYLAPSGPGSPFVDRGTVVREPVPSDFRREHPLLAHVSLADLNIREARRLQPQPGDDVLATALDVPLIVARVKPAHKTIALSFDPTRSDLPLRPALPLLLANALDWLSNASDEPATSHRAGALIRLAVPPETTRVTVRAPDGQLGSATAVDGAVDLALPRVGFYEVSPASGAARAPFVLAANAVLPLESDTSQPAAPAFAAAPHPRHEGRPSRAADIATWALALAALALAFEWWSLHRRWTV